MTSLKKLKTQFLEYIEIERGRAVRTVENYDHYLSRFLAFSKNDDPTKITPDLVRDFRLWLNRQKTQTDETMSKKTQNYYMIALRMFLKYLNKQGIKSMPADQIELAKTGERALDLITPLELERLLATPNKNDLKSLRDKAILELLFSTGLRVSELCALPREISLTSPELSVRGKGGKVRVVFISDAAKNAVQKYLNARKDMNDMLFIQIGKEVALKDAKPLTRRSVERIVKERAVAAGIGKKVTPHILRHMFATDLLSNGADLRSVQALLGHSSIVTTQIYTHITDKHLRDVHKKFHGRKST